MTARILQGNVFDLLPTIEAGSVDCAVTSPPYWMLRSYLAKDHPLKPLELGSERTPTEYIANMVRVFGLVRDCLAEHGTLWINVGDTYASGDGSSGGPKSANLKGSSNHVSSQGVGTKRFYGGIDAGNLCLIPQRLAIALQEDGWIVRSVVVWHKPAPMPASVAGWRWERCRVKVKDGNGYSASKGSPRANGTTQRNPDSSRNPELQATYRDCPGCPKCEPNGGLVLRRGSWRPTSSWEPVLMLAKNERYYCDGESVKQKPAAATVERDLYTRVLDDPDEQFAVRHDHETVCGGANLRDVWTIASEPLKEKHYAAYPSELVYRCLKAGTSARGYCPTCGKPWARVLVEADRGETVTRNHRESVDVNGGNQASGGFSSWVANETLDWRPTCRCPEHEPRPGLVLDPFAGSGRTGIEAGRLGLDFVGCDLNPEYVEMAQRLLKAENPLFA